MPLAGHAFLALWNVIAPAREPEYDRWHSLEHVPERVASPGFRGARRYVNRARTRHRYFTLYDVDTLDAFDTPEYRDLLARPTPWSASMRPDFRNFLRVQCRTLLSQGTGIGGAIACLAATDDIASGLASSLPAALTLDGVSGVHLGERAESGVRVPFAAPPPADGPVREVSHIALIEALDQASARSALRHVQHAAGLAGLAPDFGADVYVLALVFPGNDAAERTAHRRPNWAAPASKPTI